MNPLKEITIGYMIDYPIVFHSNPPESLYHYTSQQGLIGVVTKHVLWATDIRYLNDSSEYSYGEEIVKKVVSRRRKGARGDLKKFYEDFDAVEDMFSQTRFFITSLTENGNLLSQWRGYTPNGNGFSLGFSVEKLKEVLGKRGEFSLVRCVYAQAEQERLVNQAIDLAIEEWKHRDEPSPRVGNSVQIRVHPPVTLRVFCSFLAPVFKSNTFSEEKEWRLVLTQNDPSKFKFRSGQSMITPYIEVNLLADPDEPESMPLSEVIIGPTPHHDLAKLAVQTLLESQYLRAWITLSDIPFRSW
jgi:hypothetical protein